MLSERLRKLRTDNGLTLEQLGQNISLKKGSLSDVENGKTSLSLDSAIRIADYFNVSIDYLVGRSDDPTLYQPRKEDAAQSE